MQFESHSCGSRGLVRLQAPSEGLSIRQGQRRMLFLVLLRGASRDRDAWVDRGHSRCSLGCLYSSFVFLIGQSRSSCICSSVFELKSNRFHETRPNVKSYRSSCSSVSCTMITTSALSGYSEMRSSSCFFVIVLGFGDTESVHGVVVDVDERMVAVVYRGDELRQLFEAVNRLVVVHHVG